MADVEQQLEQLVLNFELELSSLEDNQDVGCHIVNWIAHNQYDATNIFTHLSNIKNKTRIHTYLIGIFCEFGIGTSSHSTLALSYYYEAAQMGYEPAYYSTAKLFGYQDELHSKTNAEQVIFWYKKAADVGSMDGLLQMGAIYLEGYKVEKDEIKGFSYIQNALNRGSTKAFLPISNLYRYGIGTAVDLYLAVYYLIRSAIEGGNTRGVEFKIFILLYETNFDRAQGQCIFKYLEEFSFKNNSFAQLFLGNLYRNGLLVKQNFQKAYFWYRKSAYGGNGEARTKVIKFLVSGTGTMKDMHLAIKLFARTNCPTLKMQKIFSNHI
ncbi:7176_t:CDS:1 [Ambispora gerdemannii]|uniref:7176_t:CDS:1 n=1 Tax=Ambispora gerdemannii TaxID=144530 RepID=A0A9N8ZKH6_9GLOM|nr:7176_t:CDS:1 [Ambispora gerdemannii]